MNLEVNLEKITPIIVACCILHNISLPFPDYLEVNTMDPPDKSASYFSESELHLNPNAAAKMEMEMIPLGATTA